MRRRRPPEPDAVLFERTPQQWRALGFDDGFPGPPADPVDAAHALIECSALTPDELAVLETVAAGTPDERLPVPFAQAALMVRRWHGPIDGVPRLMPLDHWEQA